MKKNSIEINPPCAKCGNPSLEVFGDHFVTPYNGRPYNICTQCWQLLSEDQQEEEINNQSRKMIPRRDP